MHASKSSRDLGEMPVKKASIYGDACIQSGHDVNSSCTARSLEHAVVGQGATASESICGSKKTSYARVGLRHNQMSTVTMTRIQFLLSFSWMGLTIVGPILLISYLLAGFGIQLDASTCMHLHPSRYISIY